MMRNDMVITLAHGSGGRAMQELIFSELLDVCHAQIGRGLEDAALLPGHTGSLAFTTDSFVVRPLEFPGGDIGALAACGTVNDLAMRGARPLYLSLGLIIEEGLELGLLRRVVASVGRMAAEAGVAIVTGDTKVVERGKGDGLFINTSGIGAAPSGPAPSVRAARAGDVVIVNGPIGEHGVAVMVAREQLAVDSDLRTDCAPLWGLVEAMLGAGGEAVHVLRDPTRGGLAATLNEIASASGVGIELHEGAIPGNPAVAAVCELLGLDALEVANEGKVVAIVAPEAAKAVLEAMRRHPLGAKSAVIGEVIQGHRVTLRTRLGTSRIVEMPAGELLPRIC